MKNKTVVFGSFVVDIMGRSPHLPIIGETVKGNLFKIGPGGKGFNQCVAAHKSGADVTMITKLGKDSFADIALNAMHDLHINSNRIFISDEASTGVALIMVDENTSQNKIIVIPGACDTITGEEIASTTDTLENCKYLLTQLETNISSIEKVIDIAYKKGVNIILNPAPAQNIDDKLLAKVTLITPNEVEAEILTGIPITSKQSADQAAEWFFSRGVKNVLITLGKRGVYISSNGKSDIIPAYSVHAVDTTGAGDAFNGGLLTALSEGKDLWEAAKFANALAAISVQKIGSCPSMPTREEIDNFMLRFDLE